MKLEHIDRIKRYLKNVIFGKFKSVISEPEALDISKRIFCSTIAVEMYPGRKAYIPTGFKYECPDGFRLQARSLFEEQGIFVLALTISDYEETKGDVTLLIENKGKETFVIEKGNMIASIFLEKAMEFDVSNMSTIDKEESPEDAPQRAVKLTDYQLVYDSGTKSCKFIKKDL